MRRSLAALWHGLWLNRQQQSLLTVTLSLATSLWLWLEGGRVLDVESLQTLWRGGHPPQALIDRISHILVPLTQTPELARLATGIHHGITTALAPTLFVRLLAPLADSPDLAVAIMATLSTLSLWLYCRLSRLIGIGPQTTFLLFLLLNFNPEYNDVRLQISRFQPVLILWLAGLYLFLAHYKNHIHLAFTAWAATAWTAALFVPIAAFWASGFPLLFLFWPGSGNWRRRLCERGRFLLAYYSLIALVIACVPQWHNAASGWLPEILHQIDLKRNELAFLINANNPVELGIGEGYLVSLVLVALNALKIMGPLIAILVFTALLPNRATGSVLERRVRGFFACALAWLWGMAAFAYLYYGTLSSDLFYTPFTMLTLWLVSGIVYDALQRGKSTRIPPERRLVLIWLLIACALASIITFGPKPGYLRKAGEWARHHPPMGAIYSNNLTVLAYSGRPPFIDGPAYIDMEHPLQAYYDLTPDDLLVHIKGRKQNEPQDLELFDILAEYQNERGDKAYILRLKSGE